MLPTGLTCTTNGGTAVETDLVGRRAGAQPPVPVPHPIAASQEATGAVVGLQDLPAPIQVEDADPRILEQGGHGRGARLGGDQRLPDTDELSEMGQQPGDDRDLRRPPARRGHGIVETPGDVGAVRTVQAHVQAITETAYARSDLFERRRRLMDEWSAYLKGSRRRSCLCANDTRPDSTIVSP